MSRRASLFFALFTLMLLLSLWYKPTSLDFITRAAIIGAVYGFLSLFYWRWQLPLSNGVMWIVLTAVLIVGGFYWSRSQSFGIALGNELSWTVAVNFFAAVFAVRFGLIVAVRQKGRK